MKARVENGWMKLVKSDLKLQLRRNPQPSECLTIASPHVLNTPKTRTVLQTFILKLKIELLTRELFYTTALNLLYTVPSRLTRETSLMLNLSGCVQSPCGAWVFCVCNLTIDV